MSSSPIAIYIVGPSSSGKTTLCNALATHLHLDRAAYITEVARTVMRTRGFTRDDVGRLEMQWEIMVAQVETETLARNSGSAVVLSDRCAVDPVVYAGLNVAEGVRIQRRKALVRSREFQKAVAHYRNSLVILLQPVQEFLVDDGVRSLKEPWNCLEEFRAVLRENGITFKEIGSDVKDLGERVRLVKTWASL